MTLTDRMEKLRRKPHVVTQPAEYKGSDANVWREGVNQAIDACIALAKAEEVVAGDWEARLDALKMKERVEKKT